VYAWSVMDTSAVQAALNDRYELFRRRAQMPDGASAPLLLHVFDEWLRSKRRVLVVGQETCRWGDDKLVNRFAEWRRSPDAIELLVLVYERFGLSPNYNSPFWRCFRQLMEQIEGKNAKRAIMWSNLFRIDYNGGCVRNAKQPTLRAIMSAQRGLLRDEIAI
jgi:hypothetical protein